MRNLYRDMDLSYNATSDEIKGQFKRLAKEFHPDKNKSDFAKQRFAEINQAFNVLGDEDRKREYDFAFANFQQQTQFQQQHQHQQYHTRSQADFFNSPMWSQVKHFATGMAKTFMEDLDKEIQGEFDDVDPFVERVAKLKVRQNDSGSVSITCTLSKDSLREITSMASRGMDIEEFSADVGTMFASALSQAIMTKWRGY